MCKKRDKPLAAESFFLFQSCAESTRHRSILFSRRTTVNTASFFESVPIQFLVAVGYPASSRGFTTELPAKHLPVRATFERFASKRTSVVPSNNAVVGLNKDASIGIDYMTGFVSRGDFAVSAVAPIKCEHVRAVYRRSILEQHLATAVLDVFNHRRSAVVAETVPKLQEVQRVIFPPSGSVWM